MKKLIVILSCAAVISLFGCSGGSGAGDEAWNAFQSGDYTVAHAKFTELIVADSNAYEGLLGLGWTTFRMSTDSLDQSLFYFGIARLVDSVAGVDAYAGLTFASWPKGNYDQVIQDGDMALTLDNSYVFSHDPRVTYQDIALFQAYSYYHLGNFAQCLGKIQVVDGAFTASLSSPNISTILLAKLEALANAQD